MTDASSHQAKYASPDLQQVIAGPMLRAVKQDSITLWLVTTTNEPMSVSLCDLEHQSLINSQEQCVNRQLIKIGTHAYINIVTITPAQSLIPGQRYFYDLHWMDKGNNELGLKSLVIDLLYHNEKSPSFVFNPRLSNVLHGSCRKPHHPSDDALLAVDNLLESAFINPEKQPDMLIMSGDQVYVDDVAGPMLVAIHQVIDQLGLFHTTLPIEKIKDSKQLLTQEHCYYERSLLLPDSEDNQTLIANFFGGKRKPIFTSVNANNHLISFAEVMAMYILTWSPVMWRYVKINNIHIKDKYKAQFKQEALHIKNFVAGLSKVRRALAHIPVYMIFDDHDVTDDWNLTRGWEDAVYNHPFAKRIVGNALIGYWLCQGWGNDYDKMASLSTQLLPHFTDNGIVEHDVLIDKLLDWNQWHYTLDTTPKVVVLDTRTQRWRSENSLQKPSGLMDWEALCELQQELIDQPSVIMVSAAPIFGVKFIEAVQRVFTFFGRALMVDAENWMAHKGTASVMLNIFRHHKTPPHFIILSGDVHYSFVYDITLRFRRNSPEITQVTCSGIKNEFPARLLRWFDRSNLILFSSKSPLNWFTQRRNMTIKHRRPSNHHVRTLYNGSGIGKLNVSQQCETVNASVLRVNGEEITFERNDSN